MDDPAARQRSSHVLWQLKALTRDPANRNAVIHRPGLPRMLVGLLAAEPLCQELAAETVRRLAWRSPESAAHFAGLDVMGLLVGETCMPALAWPCAGHIGPDGIRSQELMAPRPLMSLTIDLVPDASL